MKKWIFSLLALGVLIGMVYALRPLYLSDSYHAGSSLVFSDVRIEKPVMYELTLDKYSLEDYADWDLGSNIEGKLCVRLAPRPYDEAGVELSMMSPTLENAAPKGGSQDLLTVETRVLSVGTSATIDEDGEFSTRDTCTLGVDITIQELFCLPRTISYQWALEFDRKTGSLLLCQGKRDVTLTPTEAR